MAGKVVEASVAFEGEGMLSSAIGASEDKQGEDPQAQEWKGSQVLIAVPQKLDNGQIALVIVGQAQILSGVKLAADELKLGE